jgi:phosphoenolpyruvate-protein phosphotransferase
MEILTGHPVAPGYAKGRAVVHVDRGAVEIPRYRIDQADVDGELDRFHQAIERSRDELRQLERRVWAELGDTYSSIFSAHLSLLHDRQFTERVRERVRGDLINVEQALDEQIADLARMLGSLENEYLRERAHDIRDVGDRLLRQLIRSDVQSYVHLQPNSVIVARELLPSETIQLDRAHVVGIVTEQGGENSHAAILARAMGIPAVTGVHEATSRIAHGAIVLVDGSSGRVTVAPTDAALADLANLKSDYEHASAAAVDAESLECITSDGVRIALLANLNRFEEVMLVRQHHLDGVGLFRTEFLYMESPAPPTYEGQLDMYERLLECLEGLRLVIRTPDLGGDKLPLFLVPHHESNPNIGLRGLRFSLAHEDLFTEQLRALLAAGVQGDLRILFPMVLGESDLAEARRQVERLAEEMGLPCPRLGAMIECPSALFSLREILQQVDFASIGTNDLTQFMLAADRDAAELIDDYSVLHPSVLRAIRQVVDFCDEAGRELSVCGEAAGDPATACLLVGLGVRQLSVSPVRAARVRQAIRHTQSSDLADVAEQALQADSAATVKGLLRQIRSDIATTIAS